MSIKEIEKAVSQLPPNELSEFSMWFEDYLSEQWERQFEKDVASGKLDHIAKKADQDFEAGRCTPL